MEMVKPWQKCRTIGPLLSPRLQLASAKAYPFKIFDGVMQEGIFFLRLTKARRVCMSRSQLHWMPEKTTSFQILANTPNLGHVAINMGHVAINMGHVAIDMGHVAINMGHVAINNGHVVIDLEHVAINIGYVAIKIICHYRRRVCHNQDKTFCNPS